MIDWSLNVAFEGYNSETAVGSDGEIYGRYIIVYFQNYRGTKILKKVNCAYWKCTIYLNCSILVRMKINLRFVIEQCRKRIVFHIAAR